MVTDYINLERQLQPNGFDLTVSEIFEIEEGGVLEEGTKVSLKMTKKYIFLFYSATECKPYFFLDKGAYLVKFNETIHLPKNVSALTIQRSSLMRMLAHTQVGSWDAGYRGRGFSMLIVNNLDGVKIEENVRIVQMHFFKVGKVLKKYSGYYQGENLRKEIENETRKN